MRECPVCAASFEDLRGAVCCPKCSDVALTRLHASAAIRIFGRSVRVSECWEFSSVRTNGRPGLVMFEGRQRAAPDVVLMLSGVRRPSVAHFARSTCGNPLCVRPVHLVWVELDHGPKTGTPYARRHSVPGQLSRASAEPERVQELERLAAERAERAAAAPVRPAAPLADPAAAPESSGLLGKLRGARIAPIE